MENAQFTLLDFAAVCPLDHQLDVSGLTREELTLLVDTGVIVPVDATAQTAAFPLHYIVVANTARRLRDDFELDAHGLALALTLLRRMRETEAELAAVKAQLTQILTTQR